jgi:hypothetical protein
VRGGVAGWLAEHAARPSGATNLGAGLQRTAKRPVAKAASTKSPSTIRHQLGRADRELADAIVARDAVQADLVAAGGDHEELARLGAELAEQQSRVDAAEERWLALADEAESLAMDI